MRPIAGILAYAMLATATGGATGASAQPLVQTAASLGAGQFAWGGTPARGGPVTIVVSIPLQQLFVYRGAALVAVSAVSTGSRGHDTPTGAFTILQKDVDHRSNKYSDAPMPYMQRLTWDGIAIHGGRDPGYPASHGCVRVPIAFARQLYAVTSMGARVVITDDTVVPGVPVDYAIDLQAAKAAVRAAAIDPEADATRAANLAAVPPSVAAADLVPVAATASEQSASTPTP
jgi:hypothetical protein